MKKTKGLDIEVNSSLTSYVNVLNASNNVNDMLYIIKNRFIAS